MKRRLISGILSTILLTSSIGTQGIYAENSTEQIAYDMVSVVESKEQEVVNPVLLSLLEQANSEYSDNKELTVLVEIDDRVMKDKYQLVAPNITEIRSDEGLARQIDYAAEAQDNLIKALENAGVDYFVKQRYDTVLTGLAIKTKFEDAKIIAQLPEVKSIEISKFIPAPEIKGVPVYKTLAENNTEMVNSNVAWNSNYTGKGQLIAIIDSGADPYHEIFSDVDTDVAKIKSAEDLRGKLEGKDISNGKYFNSKIPFGFNYASRNTNIKENKKESHGMHVAGIVAANHEKLKGVAPDAQLAIMRVFGEGIFGGGTTPEIYNRAIDDAVKLQVDSINMSLGATGTTDSRMQKTTINSLMKAQEAGIVVAIAIGNDGFMGFGALDGPAATHPDFGLPNSPAVTDISLAVASVDNVKIKQRGIVLNTDPAQKIFYLPSVGSVLPAGDFNFSWVGYGYKEDFEGKNLRGKVALIQRGDAPGRESEEFTFAKKVKNAQDAGAAAAIVYNHKNEDQLVSMAGFSEAGVKIPSCFINRTDGELLRANESVTIAFEQEESYVTNPTGYKLSVFSSWGLTQEGNLKPDISAPGGNILSSINGGDYGVMSGTSMATPHVAGGIAVVKEYVEKKFPNIKGTEKHQLIKNLLMSTATPYFDQKAKAFTSPRGQGAGLMNLQRAIRSNVVALGTNDISSINLRNLKRDSFHISGKLKNYGDVDKSYHYYAVVNTDTVEENRILLKPYFVASTESNKKSITVPAGGEASFDVELSVSEEKLAKFKEWMPNGFFLEGYVFFESAEDETQSINIPFVGFTGDWENLKVLDDSIYEMLEANKRPYYYEKSEVVDNPFTHISSKVAGKDVVLGQEVGSSFKNPKYNKEYLAFSPNGDGRADSINFVGTFLRNYRDFEMKVIKSEEGNETEVYRVKEEDDFGIKNYVISGFGGPNLTTSKNHWKWEGKSISDLVLPDGSYQLEISVKPDGKGEVASQVMKLPIKIDTLYPRIVQSSYDQASGEYRLLEVEETGVGIRDQVIYIGTQEYRPDEEGVFKLPSGTDPESAAIEISDHAYNTVRFPLKDSIRKGDEKTVMVIPKISVGTVPSSKYQWVVLDEKGIKANPYNLKVGKYKLVIENVFEPFEVVGSKEFPFEVKESDTVINISVPFNISNRNEAHIPVNKPRKVSISLSLLDSKTGMEFPLAENGSQYSAFVPAGIYSVIVKNITEGYFATLSGENKLIVYANDVGTPPIIQVKEARPQDVKIKVVRNGYEGALKVVFMGKDMLRSSYEAVIEPGSNESSVKLPRRLRFNVYVKDLEGSTHGMETFEFEESLESREVTVTLESGKANAQIPVDKTTLITVINRARTLNEKDYSADSWFELEKALEKAEKVYKHPLSSQIEVNEAMAKLRDAIDALKPRVAGDKAALKEKLDEAWSIFQNLDDSYTEETKEFLGVAIEAAKIVYESNDPKYNTEAHIRETIDMLQRAIDNLKKVGETLDTARITALISKAEELLKNAEQYTEDTLSDLRESLQEAKEVLKDPESKQEDINSAARALSISINLLKSKADKTQLKKAIEEAEKVDLNRYRVAERAAFRKALRKAEELYRNSGALESEITEAIRELNAARAALVPIEEDEAIGEDLAISSQEKNRGIDVSKLKAAARVIKTDDGKYQYTIRFDKEEYTINGMNFETYVNKLYVGSQVISGEKTGNQTQFVFELDRPLKEVEVQIVLDIMEEFGLKPVRATILF